MKKVKLISLCMAIAMLVGLCPTWVSADSVTVALENVVCTKKTDQTGAPDNSFIATVTGTATVTGATNAEVALLMIGSEKSPGVTGESISVSMDETDKTAWIYYVDQVTASGTAASFTFDVVLPEVMWASASDDENTKFLYLWAGTPDAAKAATGKGAIVLPGRPVSAAVTVTKTGESEAATGVVVPAKDSNTYTVSASGTDKYGFEVSNATVDVKFGPSAETAGTLPAGITYSNNTITLSSTANIAANNKLFVTATAGSETDTKELPITIEAKIANNIKVTADSTTIAVPTYDSVDQMVGAEGNRPSREAAVFTAGYYMDDIAVTAPSSTAWSLEQEDGSALPDNLKECVTISSAGMVTVDVRAAAAITGSVTIVVKATGTPIGATTPISGTAKLTITAQDKGTPKFIYFVNAAGTGVETNPEASIQIPAGDTPNTLDLKLTESLPRLAVRDAYGLTAERTNLTYTGTATDHISINEGVVSVTKDATESESMVVTIGGIQDVDDVTVTIKPQLEALSFASVSVSQITGGTGTNSTIPMPGLNEAVRTRTVRAVPMSQYPGSAFSGTISSVAWSVVGNPAGVTVAQTSERNSEAVLTITSDAYAAFKDQANKTITVKADVTIGGETKSGTIEYTLGIQTKYPAGAFTLSAVNVTDNTIEVPVASATYQLTPSNVKDQYGEAYGAAITPTYTVMQNNAEVPTNSGVSIDSNGLMTITKDALALVGELRVVASLTTKPDDTTLADKTATAQWNFTLKKADAVADVENAQIKLDGAAIDQTNAISIPEASATAAVAKTLTVEVKDQYGDNVTNVEIVAAEDLPTGVTLTGKTITVEKTAVNNTFENGLLPIELKLKINNTETSKVWTLYLKKDASKATDVKLTQNPAGNVAVPAEGEMETITYTAAVVDQYDAPMSGDYTYTFTTPTVTGVTFSENGAVLTATVDAAAQVGTFNVKVSTTIEGAAKEKTITTTLVEAAERPVPTSIRISAPSSIRANSSRTVTETLSATVVDQNGAPISASGNIRWEVTDSVSGVSVDAVTGVVTVNSNAANGTLGVRAYIDENDTVAGTTTITIRRANSSQTNNNNNRGGGTYVIPSVDPAVTPGTTTSVGKDVASNHWAKSSIDALVNRGLVSGDEGTGNVRPDAGITREEIAAVLCRAMNIAPASQSTLLAGDPSSAWAAGYLTAAKSHGIMLGDEVGFMNGQKVSTRGEAVTLIARAMNLSSGDLSVLDGFADADQIPDWSKAYASAMIQSGMLKGYAEDNTLRLGNNITRAEIFTLLARYLQLN